MTIELINREDAYKKYRELKEIALSIANANGVMPGECSAPECILYMAYAMLSSTLKTGEACIFINKEPAYKLSGADITSGEEVISKFCVQNVKEVCDENNNLLVKYHDGVIENYIFIDNVNAWKFKGKNISVNLPSTSGN